MPEIKSEKDRVVTVRDALARQKTTIVQAIPKFLSAERFMTLAFTAIQRNPKLLDAWMPSLLGAVVKAAQLGLEIDDVLGHAHLVPFKNSRENRTDVVLIPGYRGLMDLARRGRTVSTIDAHTVYTVDDFDYAYGSKPFIHHKPKWGKRHALPDGKTDIEAIKGFYAIARLRDGACQFWVLSLEETLEIRDRFSRGFQQDPQSPWVYHFDQMGEKSALRRLCAKRLPASPELLEAANLDDRAEAGVPVVLTQDDMGVWGQPEEGNGGGTTTTTPQPAPTSRFLGAMTEKLQQEEKTGNGRQSHGAPPATGASGPESAGSGGSGQASETPATTPTTGVAGAGSSPAPGAPAAGASSSGMIQCNVPTCMRFVADLEEHHLKEHPKRAEGGARAQGGTKAPRHSKPPAQPFTPPPMGGGPLLPGEPTDAEAATRLTAEYEAAIETIKTTEDMVAISRLRAEWSSVTGLLNRLDHVRRMQLASALMDRMSKLAAVR